MNTISPTVLAAASESPSPCYVYDLPRLRRRCEMLAGMHLERKRLFFATMANDHPAILKCIHAAGHGVFVNSLRHLRLVRRLGFSGNDIVFAASNMELKDFAACAKAGVHLVLDSVQQLSLLGYLDRPPARVGIRVNVGNALDRKSFRPDPGYRFGLLPDEIATALGVARTIGVRIEGVHAYLGTGILAPALLHEGLEQLASMADRVPGISYI